MYMGKVIKASVPEERKTARGMALVQDLIFDDSRDAVKLKFTNCTTVEIKEGSDIAIAIDGFDTKYGAQLRGQIIAVDGEPFHRPAREGK